MNANELADLIERCNDCGYNQDAANMLRQMVLAESIIAQQNIEIKALKEALSMKIILNEHAQQSMKEYKELLK